MSTAAIPVRIALIDETGEINTNELATVAGALSEQVQADFAPIWKVSASVGVAAQVPVGTWQIVIQKQLDQPGALGFHTDENNQPISYVELTSDWTVTVSHECLEMLADPWGNRIHSARLPDAVKSQFANFGLQNDTQTVRYLLEVCDPCERTSYPVGGVPLSDFLIPNWYRSAAIGADAAYSHAGGCTGPRQVADGGYVSFSNHNQEWYQIFNENGSLQIQDIGTFDKSQYGSLREFSDAKAREYRTK